MNGTARAGTAARRAARAACLASYFGLMALLALWSTVLAPHPRFPVALVLLVSVGPLMLPLRGLLHGRPYTHAWASFLALYYFVISVDDIAAGMAPAALAWLELALSLAFYGSAVAYARLAGRRPVPAP